MSHVFISYSHTDAEFAENVKNRLEKADIDVWIDEERLQAGEDWREEIDQALSQAFALILIMSPASLQSRYVMYEWSYAWGAGKKVIPLLYKNIDKEQIHPRLDKRQYLNFMERAVRPWDQLVQRLTQIQTQRPASRAGDTATHLIEEKKLDARTQALLDTFHSGEYPERIAAIKLLRQLGDRDILDDIISALRSDELWQVRAVAAQIIGDFGESSATIDLLLALQADGDIDVRCCAAEALGKIGDEIAIPALIECLEDREKTSMGGRLCDWAAESLRQIDTKEALAALGEWENTPPPDDAGDIPF